MMDSDVYDIHEYDKDDKTEVINLQDQVLNVYI